MRLYRARRLISVGIGAFRRIVPPWWREWDFLLVLLAGASLRLVGLDTTSFLGDQAELLSLGRSALDHHALIATGIPSSIGTLNPPASIYMLLPFALLGGPLLATVATALANVIAVIALYALARRYMGRWAAFAGGLLYATAPWPIFYSRFIWQQNLLALCVVLFIWTLCLAVIDGRRGWWGWHLFFWAVAVQLHPTAAPLLGVTAVGLVLGWRTLRWRDLAWGALALSVVFFPTLLWEIASQGSDITLLRAALSLPSQTDAASASILLRILTPPGPSFYGNGSPYAQAAAQVALLTPILSKLFTLSMLWVGATLVWQSLVGDLLANLRRRRARSGSAGASEEQTPDYTRPMLRALASLRWRFLVLLYLWVMLPVLATQRHSQPIYPHYLIVVLPGAFLVMGLFLASAAERLFARGRLADSFGGKAEGRWRFDLLRATPLIAVTLVLSGAQGYAAMAGIVTTSAGHYVADANGSHYGLSLADEQAALAAGFRAAQQDGARVYIASDALHQEPFGYLATTGAKHATVFTAQNCLVVPAPGASSAVIVSVYPQNGHDMANLIESVQGSALVATLPTTAGYARRVYRLSPGAYIAGETPMPAGVGSDPYLAGFALMGSVAHPELLLHWAGVPSPDLDQRQAPAYWRGASPQSGATPLALYTFSAQALDDGGQAVGVPVVATCPDLTWGRGEEVYTRLTLPTPLVGAAATGQRWRVSATRATLTSLRPTLGPVALETGDLRFGDQCAACAARAPSQGVPLPGATIITTQR